MSATHGNNLSFALVEARTTTGVGEKVQLNGPKHSFQITGTTSSGAGAAVVVIEVTAKESPTLTAGSTDWLTAGTATLTLSTTSAAEGFNIDANWRWVRWRVASISGTGAAINVYMGN